METDPRVDEILHNLPAQFYDQLIRDVSPGVWVRILGSNPILKRQVLEGFSLQPGKFSRMVTQPVIMGRLARKLQSDRAFLVEIMEEWTIEHTAIITYLGALDFDYLKEFWRNIRDLLRPERLLIALYSMGFLAEEGITDIFDEEDYWSSKPDESLFSTLVPVLTVWGAFIEEHPDLAEKFLSSERGGAFSFALDNEEAQRNKRSVQESPERLRKVEKKLEKAQADVGRAIEQVSQLRSENEELKKKVRELERDFDRRLGDALAKQRKEWFERYQEIDREAGAKESDLLESLLQRTRRAFELQKKADEEYGLVADIRAKMLEIDMALAKIETVYADSLVVHKEIEKIKEALVTEKNRILKLPGIRKIAGKKLEGAEELIGRINLLDPLPANLPRIDKLLGLTQQLSEIGMWDNPTPVKEAARHKKRQILERLYSLYEPRIEDLGRERPFGDFSEFVNSGESRKYSVFVDGYNVLLRVHGEKQFSRTGFTDLREQFVESVLGKSRSFAGLHLVFDGVEDSTRVQGNVEIIYTDKTRLSADSVIIQRISSRRDKKNLLVTADREIISSVQNRIYAIVDPVAFYMFLYE